MKLLKYSLLSGVIAASAISAPAFAEAGDTFVRVRAIVVAPTETSGGILPTFPTEEVKVNSSIMPEVDITHMVTKISASNSSPQPPSMMRRARPVRPAVSESSHRPGYCRRL